MSSLCERVPEVLRVQRTDEEGEIGMKVRVREQRLPGIGHRYDIQLDDGRHLFVVVQTDGRRTVGIMTSASDNPDVVAILSQDQAVAVAAILTGARFAIDTREDERIAADEVAVESISVGERSPAVGRMAPDIARASGADVAILAIIRDDDRELVEDTATEPIRAGDRVVVAVPRDQLQTLVGQLSGDR
ncbi:MAG: hypothetical protein M3198_11710 [Actinomycetota bacterium]|nr:hypothetical protein [Actinomycetota bacterium]